VTQPPSISVFRLSEPLQLTAQFPFKPTAAQLTLSCVGLLALATAIWVMTAAARSPAGVPRIDHRRREGFAPSPWYWILGSALLAGLYAVDSAEYLRAAVASDEALAGEGVTDADASQPFTATQYQASLRAKYHEPSPGLASAGLPPSPIQLPAPTDIPATVLAKASRFYDLRCASCHGNDGDGNGPAAEMVKPKPRNYRDQAWQQTVTDQELAKAIVKGGRAVGKSYMMPAAYDLEKKPEMVRALVYQVRSFGERP
jgi:mono/diheme cytochrome c family protein